MIFPTSGRQRERPSAAAKKNDDDIKNKKEIEPIIVRRKPSGRLRGKYQVMDGHHRLEAHLRMNLKHIPAVIIHPQNVKYDGIEEK